MIATASSQQQQELEPFEGIVIDSIEIDNRNIYDVQNPAYNNIVFRTANHLHIVTRQAVVRREILLHVGEPFSVDIAEESARNMRARLALYDAWVEIEKLAEDKLLVRFVTVDEWSISGGIRYNRDGNLDKFKFGLTERNLLGQAVGLGADYYIEDGKNDYIAVSFVGRRFQGHKLQIKGTYSGNPEAKRYLLGLSRPYYDLMQSWKWGISGGGTTDLREIYSDDRLIASNDDDADRLSIVAGGRTGRYDKKLEFDVLYDYVCETTRDRRFYSNSPEDSTEALANFPTDSMFHRIGLVVGVLVHDYVTLRRIDCFGAAEDFRIGPILQISASYAFSHDSTAFRQMGVGLGWTGYRGQTLFAADGETSAWHDRSGQLVRRLYALRLWLYNWSLPMTTMAFNARFMEDQPIGGVNRLVMGGTTGLRGYDKYFMTGDRRLIANLEARFLPGLEILSVQFGATLFVDYGQTWEYGEELGLDEAYAAIGIGIRVSGEKSSRSALGRLDLSYSEATGWQISVGSGQYFESFGASLPLTTY